MKHNTFCPPSNNGEIKMLTRLRFFVRNETGSVTTDWVVLVASLILLSMVIMTSITGGALGVSSDVSTNLAAMDAG